jgi:hypothetical protein
MTEAKAEVEVETDTEAKAEVEVEAEAEAEVEVEAEVEAEAQNVHIQINTPLVFERNKRMITTIDKGTQLKTDTMISLKEVTVMKIIGMPYV